MSVLLPIALALLAVAAPARADGDGVHFGPPLLVTQLLDPELTEASGLAASRLDPKRIWLLNDSGNEPLLFAVDRRGNTRSRSVIRATRNIDWEAIDAFRLDSKAWLMVADIGDNSAVRAAVDLHFILEPEELPAPELSVARTLHVTLPDGPADMESAFVDASAGWIYLLTKRESPPLLLRVPLHAEAGTTVRAERLGPVPGIPRPTPADLREDQRLGPYRGQPTDAAMRPDRSGIVILTYRDAYWFARSEDQSWLAALQATPVTIPLPRLSQAEGIAFTTDSRAILVTSEHWPAPLIELQAP